MALPSWWTPWQYGTGWDEKAAPIELMNWLIPYMAPKNQAGAANYLYGQRAAAPELYNQFGGYGSVTGNATPTDQWLKNISGFNQSSLPSYYDVSSPEYNWLMGGQNLSKQLNPNMSRQNQMGYSQGLNDWMNQAPSKEMQGVGTYLMNPTLTRPEYGSAAALGNYQQPFKLRGGLVSNPWYK